MADREHLQLLMAAVSSIDSRVWNGWREKHPSLRPDLSDVDLSSTDLRILNLSDADMYRSNLAGASLAGASLNGADLTDAILRGADLSYADLKCAHLRRADLSGANLTSADMRFADLWGVNLANAKLLNVRVSSTERGFPQINPRLGADVLDHRKSSMGATLIRLVKMAQGMLEVKRAK